MPGISTLNPLSPQAAAISHLFVAILVVLGAIFLLVLAMVGYAIVRYRDRPGAPPPRQNFGSLKIEITWTVIPIILLAIILVFTVAPCAQAIRRSLAALPRTCASSAINGGGKPIT